MKKKTNNMKKVKNRAIFQPWSPTTVSARKEDSQKAERKFILCHLLTREGDHQYNTTHTHI